MPVRNIVSRRVRNPNRSARQSARRVVHQPPSSRESMVVFPRMQQVAGKRVGRNVLAQRLIQPCCPGSCANACGTWV